MVALVDSTPPMCDFLDSFDYEKPLSLYIHVPFCDSKCSYCAFFSVSGYHDDVKKCYASKLLEELEEVVDRMEGRAFETAYIGGGNPGCLDVRSLCGIAALVCRNGRPKEFTIEMNPDSLSPEMGVLFDGLFTRLSLGVQSLDGRALEFLGRNATLGQTYQGLELSQGISLRTGCDLSYDLITCLGPWHDPLKDVQALCNGFPSNHLSVYALTLEEGTSLFKRHPSLPDDDMQARILESVWCALEDRGFEHYEVSNFARNGRRGLHNCRYWGYRPYVGLGPGAASTAFKDGLVRRFDSKKSVCEYIKGHRFGGVSCETLTREEALEEFVLMGLRYKGGLDLGRLENEFGCKVRPSMLDNIGGCFVENGRLVPSNDGLLIADYSALEILNRLSSTDCPNSLDSANRCM